MKPSTIDAILATNPRYVGAAFQKPETEGAFIPMPNTGMVRVQQDAKLNAAKAIVAERLVEALGILLDCERAGHWPILKGKFLTEGDAAMAAWRELISEV